MKLKPILLMPIIGIMMLITGIILISVGATTRLPVFESKMHERLGNATVSEPDVAMIASGTGLTFAGLGLTIAGGLLSRRRFK